MTAPQVIPVRVCGECGRVCDAMDTRCPACLRYGGLRDRFQCSGCEAVLDESVCTICTPHARLDTVPRDTYASRVDRSAPPPWLAGAVGGALLGGLIGAGAGLMLHESLWLTCPLGLVPGLLAGALLTRDKGPTS